MKVIYSIAKNEFRYLFYSPIAWFVLLVFFILCAQLYTGSVYGWANILEVNLKHSPIYTPPADFTKELFILSGFISTVAQKLFLFLPLLTMGLINRDYTNGTHALLFSSPVSIKRVVLGKYLGIMLYNLLLLMVLTIFIVMGMFNIASVDYGPLLSILLAFYLQLCVYSAIGLFMSSLSNYQIVSAIATFLVLFAFGSIGYLWQEHDFVRDLTWFLSLQNRFGNMAIGLVMTRDVLYFILLSLMFVTFTYFRLLNKLTFKPWYIRTGRVLSVLMIVLTIGYIFSKPALTGYWDTTSTQKNTIHPKTQQVLQELGDSTLEVTFYTNLLGEGVGQGLPKFRNLGYLADFWDAYLRFKPDIKFNYVYYYSYDSTKDERSILRNYPGKSIKEIAQYYCIMYDTDLSLFQTASQLPPSVNLNGEDHRSVMELKYKGRTTFLRTYGDARFWPYQSHVIAALKRVMGEEIPTIGYSTGSLERSIYKLGGREYALHSSFKGRRDALVNNGFDIDTINLHTQEIPDNLTALVVADPKIELSGAVQEKIGSYIDQGGNLMIYGEPGKQYVLNPLLSQLGVQLAQGQLVYPTYDETPDKVIGFLSESSRTLSASMTHYLINKTNFDTIRVPMTSSTAVLGIGGNGWLIDSLVNSIPDKSWLKKGSMVIDSILPPFNPTEGDIKLSSFPILKVMKRMHNEKEQRVIISGDADFVLDVANEKFLSAMYSWMVYDKFPINTFNKAPIDTLNIGERKAYYQKMIFVWILPSILLLVGIGFLVRRKRK